MATDHASTVKGLLDTAGVSDVYRGLMREGPTIPDQAVFVETTGGFAPEGLFGSSIDVPTVQIVVRGTADGKRDEAHAVARACYDAVDYVVPTGYIACRPVQSGPISIGQDDKDRYIFSINIALEIHE